MRSAIKNQKKIVQSWQLGAGSTVEHKLLREGKIIFHSPDKYELFSQEATGQTGEAASSGDYFKIDSTGRPYPNAKDFFEANHTHLSGDQYLQIPKPLQIWFLGDPEDEIISFLRRHKGLQINPDSADACFSAPLWGTLLVAKKDAVIVIYNVAHDDVGKIIDVDFNFVARDEFEKAYQLI